MNKVLGLDLGTNSIGITVRDTDNGTEILNQLDYFSSVIFKSGVGNGKSGEFSYAAERTKKRSTRRLYMARKYRIWATLKLLIENGYCPLDLEDLEKWSRYDKVKDLNRQYPIEAERFEQWVRLDFNGDGIADYSSPYQLRAELMEKQFDFTQEIERYKLGRALYHIAQRRGFKSSKGETIKEQEKNELIEPENADIVEEMKNSELKKSGVLKQYMVEHNLKTVGCAFYALEKSGVRVRNSEYQAVRTQYKEEIEQIFSFQDGLDQSSEFYKCLVSEKKGEGTIFYKRPLRSQKGLVGKCTLEPDKPRCPISHPEFEKYRAWCLINNIKFGEGLKENLTIEQKRRLYDERFLLTRSNFKFEDIRKWLESETGEHLDYKQKTINYKDNANVSGCPVTARLKKLLGDDWESWEYKSGETKSDKKTGEVKQISYSAYDLWHICFSFDEPDFVEDFAQKKLGFDKDKTKQLVRVYGTIQEGYGMLSLKAIRNINRFLEKGLIYSDAVILAKLPYVFGEKWSTVEDEVIEQLDNLVKKNRYQKLIYGIVNSLIANYKSLEIEEQFANFNTDYKLDESDFNDVKKVTIRSIGEKTWGKKSENEQADILNKVAELYQMFFASSKRDYYKLPKVSESISVFLKNKYSYLDEKKLRKIYHPSLIEFYAPSKLEKVEGDRYLKLLGSPVIGALKNPMAMRVLHTLRKQVNALLKATDENGNAMIDEDTRVVVETARELNDANMRWAIEAYQREREKENKEYKEILKDYYQDKEIKDSDINEVRLLCEQHDISLDSEGKAKDNKQKESFKDVYYKKDITKYRLWLEQGCRCIYTGKIINITSLFDENAFDIEHTIPRSLSFDDSLANLTVCDAHFNRTIKKNQIPSQLSNYDEILRRIQPWMEKVEQLKDNVEYWKSQSKRAQDKERKDQCIRQRHLWQMELDYWQNKVNRFTMTEVTMGFRNSQLVDTRIITKYAYHYLKTVFNKVEVQKGSVTANFRKMLGIQSVDEKKSRDKHSHHAVDATVLTLIPVAAKRDKMLELFYCIQERKRLDEDTMRLESELRKEIKSCKLGGNISDIVPYIENNILVNHVSKDQTLVPSRRRKRMRGKVVCKTDEKGQVVYDEIGRPEPKEWITGDSIRGQLHGETFYGAITQGRIDDEGRIRRDGEGNVIIGDKIYYVVRRELKYKASSIDSGFKDWAELENAVVDKALFAIMKGQFFEGTSFKDACASGIFMYKKNKEGVIDFAEDCKVNRIRHIRCFTSVKNPLKVKNQTYLSKKPYKHYYYAEMGDLYVMCKYENDERTEKEYHVWSLFDVSNNRKSGIEDVPDVLLSKKNTRLQLTQQIKAGDMVLLYKDTPQELIDMDRELLSQRLYVVRGFENPSLIKLVRHINAQPDKELGKGESIKDYLKMPEKIRCGINTLKYLINEVDFYLTSEGVVFKKTI
jgi:CRISPR-associated endonuclease Csn1